jgi:hypothetical protein
MRRTGGGGAAARDRSRALGPCTRRCFAEGMRDRGRISARRAACGASSAAFAPAVWSAGGAPGAGEPAISALATALEAEVLARCSGAAAVQLIASGLSCDGALHNISSPAESSAPWLELLAPASSGATGAIAAAPGCSAGRALGGASPTACAPGAMLKLPASGRWSGGAGSEPDACGPPRTVPAEAALARAWAAWPGMACCFAESAPSLWASIGCAVGVLPVRAMAGGQGRASIASSLELLCYSGVFKRLCRAPGGAREAAEQGGARHKGGAGFYSG